MSSYSVLRTICCHVEFVTLLSMAACTSPEPVAPMSVSGAWQEQDAARSEEVVDGGSDQRPRRQPDARRAPVADPIATIDGHPMARSRMVGLLLRGQGPALLEQLVVLDLAERLAAKRGLSVTAADVQRETDGALRRLVDPLPGVTSGTFDREAADRILDLVLARRNISRVEFRITVRRNATLRRIVEAAQTISEEQLHREFERLYGQRVQVRHIQLATLGEVGRVRDRLASGEAFEEVARKYSANRITAEAGGLLVPISLQDDGVPAVLREVVSKLQPGQVSDAVRIGEWYHILKLVGELPPESVTFDAVRGALERRVRKRLADPAIQALHDKLFRAAKIEIHDPVLRDAFDALKTERGG